MQRIPSLISFLFVALVTSSHAESRLRARRQQEVSTFRITVIDNLFRHEDGSLSSVDEITAIPIVGGAEEPTFYPIDLPESVKANYIDRIENGALYVDIAGAKIGEDSVTYGSDSDVVVLENSPIAARKLSQKQGERSVLVIRVETERGEGSIMGYTEEDITKHFFTGKYSLKTQIENCSNGSLKIISKGIISVRVEGESQNYGSSSKLRNKALETVSIMRNVRGANEIADVSMRSVNSVPHSCVVL